MGTSRGVIPEIPIPPPSFFVTARSTTLEIHYPEVVFVFEA